MNWREIAVTVSSEGEEAVTDLFYQLGSKGVAVESPQLLHDYIEADVWDYHDFKEVGDLSQCIVKGYFPEDERLRDRLKQLTEKISDLQEIFPGWFIEVRNTTVKEEDWANSWKQYYKPIKIGKKLLIKPTWEQVRANAKDIVLEIDPGMAFGTGTHPTTHLCLEAIEKLVQPGNTVYDIGTGSGILAAAAAKLGACVKAADIDPMAIKTAKENAHLNHTEKKMEFYVSNLGKALLEMPDKADIVIANITADIIIDFLPQLPALMKENGYFLASGIIDTRADEVAAEMIRTGLEIVERQEDSGWVLITACRKK